MHRTILTIVLPIILLIPESAKAQHSVARKWNEALLDAIRIDYARPTVHARNLYHTAAALYDAWAIFDESATPVFLGEVCPFDGFVSPADTIKAREEIMSYATFRLLKHRFRFSPGRRESQHAFRELMKELGYHRSFTSVNYSKGDPAALGNYLGDCIIKHGALDGANEGEDYANSYYEEVNPLLVPDHLGNDDLQDPDRWQPLGLELYIDQSGHQVISDVPKFLSPEWGNVTPFSLSEEEMVVKERDGHQYKIYHDPGPPPYINSEDDKVIDQYKWGFELVAIWASHLDPQDSVMWDISPRSIGNISRFPESFEEYDKFYRLIEGGDPSVGHKVNPHTGQPYEPQLVPRADYARVLAEFWADGPDSETPPGHWFTILNYVNDHPDLVKKFGGKGDVLDPLEWDVKSYLALGGALHDAAIAAWSIKGYYDYIRPISAIRYMAAQGQSTSPDLPNYSPHGIPLIDGYVEQIVEPTRLGQNPKNIGKIKIRAWRGPDYIINPQRDIAGVGWILAEDWWPYQRPTFVTPPFAGYVSGHSTFSRAAAEVMTLLTGDEFFPGGMGEFVANKNEFLVFENGPSVDVTLQWATYRDASDQTSLSRIWGGIHPPADDIPGRLIGEKIGIKAFKHATRFFGLDEEVVEPN